MPRKSINPSESFTLIPSEHTFPSYGSLTQRTPILSIYASPSTSTTTASEKTSSPPDKPKPRYTIMLPLRSSFFIPSWWVWTADPAICLHDGSLHQSSFPNISSAYDAVAAKRATISDLYFAAHFCTVGTVYHSLQTPSSRSAASSTPTPTPSANNNDLTISSGLGHGEWYDAILPVLLGRSSSDDVDSTTGRRIVGRQQPRAIWHASPTGWRHRENLEEVEWAGLGRSKNGAIMVTDQEGIMIAVYLPRGSTVVPPDSSSSEKRGGIGGGCGMGRLGLCVDLEDGEEDEDQQRKKNRKEEVIKHLLLVAVGIEEQILRNRGFRGAYHGGWAYVPKGM